MTCKRAAMGFTSSPDVPVDSATGLRQAEVPATGRVANPAPRRRGCPIYNSPPPQRTPFCCRVRHRRRWRWWCRKGRQRWRLQNQTRSGRARRALTCGVPHVFVRLLHIPHNIILVINLRIEQEVVGVVLLGNIGTAQQVLAENKTTASFKPKSE
jgi:hypothetical protein